MPDVWTNHPEIVRDLLKEAGFRCGVEGRFLKGRDPAWTCAFDGKAIYGDLYIHHADALRSERPLDGRARATEGGSRGHGRVGHPSVCSRFGDHGCAILAAPFDAKMT